MSKLKPIYEIIEDSDKKELSSAVFYLKVAHIVKSLENSMVNQIVKKFENENKESTFDIDFGTSKIELKDKEFTYYIEDEVFQS